MNVHHVVTVAIIGVAFSLFLTLMFSLVKEMDKIECWKERIVVEMCARFNVRQDRAWEVVERAYPTRKAMYAVLQLNPKMQAIHLFWENADLGEWMPVHFNDRKLPEQLYFHPRWGGIVVEA